MISIALNLIFNRPLRGTVSFLLLGIHVQHTGEAVLRKHLRRKLRTFEETQISNIIGRAKGKRTILLKFHQFYAKKSRRDTHKSRKQFFSNRKQQKTHLSQP